MTVQELNTVKYIPKSISIHDLRGRMALQVAARERGQANLLDIVTFATDVASDFEIDYDDALSSIYEPLLDQSGSNLDRLQSDAGQALNIADSVATSASTASTMLQDQIEVEASMRAAVSRAISSSISSRRSSIAGSATAGQADISLLRATRANNNPYATLSTSTSTATQGTNSRATVIRSNANSTFNSSIPGSVSVAITPSLSTDLSRSIVSCSQQVSGGALPFTTVLSSNSSQDYAPWYDAPVFIVACSD